jgi:hypothetical protein
MSKSSAKNEPTNYPEYAVRAEVICRFFSPPLASSTFHDFVNKGRITPMKGIRGFYMLNDSLRRLGLRELAKLPDEIPARTPEEIIHFAFHAIDPEIFYAPSWLLNVETIDAVDLHHAELIAAQHSGHVAILENDRLKYDYLQGVLDHAAMDAADRAAAG